MNAQLQDLGHGSDPVLGRDAGIRASACKSAIRRCALKGVEELPKTAQELVRAIGLNATIDLVKMFGGNEFYLPGTNEGMAKLWAWLVEAVGAHAAEQLVEHFGGTRIYVPTCRDELLKLRNREICERYNSGEPFAAIRWRFKVSRSYLFRLLKKPS